MRSKLERESAALEVFWREKAEKDMEHVREELQSKLLLTQTELRQSLQGATISINIFSLYNAQMLLFIWGDLFGWGWREV